MQAEQVTGPIAFHGEGPVWWPGWGGLRWVDMLAGDVLSLGADGEVERRHVADIVAALRPRADGGAVLGIERGFALEDPDGGIRELHELRDDENVRMNEGGCDPLGRFWCGSMAYDQTPGAGTLYRLDPDGSSTAVLEGVTVSNGIDWSPDGLLAYYNDTPTNRVTVFDHDVSGLHLPRPFVELGELRPDGLTVDAEGGVWVAMSNGGVVHRYSSDGVLDQVVELPVPKVTACTLGGEQLDELYITTSRERVDVDRYPNAGSLFRAPAQVRGQPARVFAG